MIHDKIIEIIVFLLNELKNNKQIGEHEFKNLETLGYSENEINTAFSWIFTKMQSGETVFTASTKTGRSHRFLHQAEKGLITAEAFGYMIQLKELGLLSDTDIENLIEKIMISGYSKTSVRDMKFIIAGYLIDLNDMSNNNRRVMINENDTIH